MKYENGDYGRTGIIVSRHPNILRGVITSKKGWGLWVKEWSDGISQGLFQKEEILDEFRKNKIELPESFLIEFDNIIRKKKYKMGD
jgi:hypothetical protein